MDEFSPFGMKLAVATPSSHKLGPETKVSNLLVNPVRDAAIRELLDIDTKNVLFEEEPGGRNAISDQSLKDTGAAVRALANSS